jgi:hypothetical protein
MGPVADVGDDVCGGRQGFDVGADSVHLGDLGDTGLGPYGERSPAPSSPPPSPAERSELAAALPAPQFIPASLTRRDTLSTVPDRAQHADPPLGVLPADSFHRSPTSRLQAE